ncbi:MAG: class I SAM-dependent methyltransferase [Clostridia bacterium]|nr:class I SAM-dependent methyltransferase [Clostridia bacterium]
MKYEPAFFEIFLTRIAFLFFGRSVYQGFADRLPLDGGERVLDFGSGMGTVAYYVAEKLPRGRLICLDISERWLNACRKTLRGYENISFRHWETPELIDECFDVVYCHYVLHDISESELKKVIAVLAEALKPGGVFAFREPLYEGDKIKVIKSLIEENGLGLKESRITDIPLLGNALENFYIK